ncbi:MAG: DNA replication complex subunit Gins51 [Promethearchaeota archaeon]
MNFKKEYEDLYNQWLTELEQVNLTDLREENFIRYQEIKSKINDFNLIDNDPIKIRLIKEYRENFNYLFNDFLHIRKIKIINSAMVLEEINLNHLIEHEKFFYQNLVGSFKGYNKIKTISLLKKPQEELISEEIAKSILEKDTLDIHIPEKTEPIKSTDYLQEETEYQYTLVRMVKKSPPLVGVDLKTYGPFEKEDVINLPYKNAIILINEKFAEKIELA